MKTGAIILFILVSSYLLYNASVRFFVIRTIEIEGENVRVEIDVGKVPKNILFFPASQSAVALKQRYPQIEYLDIRKVYPETLRFTIRLRSPVATVRTADLAMVLDRYGYVVGYPGKDEAGLPTIISRTAAANDEAKVADPGLQNALRLIMLIRNEIRVDSVTPENAQTLRIVSGKTTILVSQKHDIEQIAATLQTIFRGVRMKGTIPATIDLRFAKPVIIY